MDSRSGIPDCGFDEPVNSWDDWAPVEERDLPREIYTSAEIAGIRSVGEAIEAFCLATPSSISNSIETIQLSEWIMVTEIAERTLGEMMKRGKFAEEEGLDV